MGWINRRTVPQLVGVQSPTQRFRFTKRWTKRCYYALVVAAGCMAPSAFSADAASCREAAQVAGGLEAASGCVIKRLRQSRERTRRLTEKEKSGSS